MDMRLLARRDSVHESARKEALRRQYERALTCENCGNINRPGSITIDIDELDRALCSRCDYQFAIYIPYGDGT